MKTKLICILLAVTLCLGLTIPAFAATTQAAVIDTTRPVRLELYKYDLTSATEDGVLRLDSYVSTGTANPAAQTALAEYAIQGVTFTYVKIADIVQYSAQEADGYKVMPLYRFADNAQTTALLAALGIAKADAYRDMEFTADALNAALAGKLEENASAAKDALEALAKTYGTAMPETDAAGHSKADNLAQGLYLLVETAVPENVSRTTAPFFVSLPMTTVDGSDWNYDVIVYPKNETDQPTLDKLLKSQPDGDFAHMGTAGIPDTVDYKITSTLPSITSTATYLTAYTFEDILSDGLTYVKNDVVLTWYKDASCTERITAWEEASGKFSVTYDGNMTIAMTQAGLDELNSAETVYDAASQYRGYSGCTLQITYAAKVNNGAVLGDGGNDNKVTLTWSRTSTSYFDMLHSDAHIYTYGIDLTKLLSNGVGGINPTGDFTKVSFTLSSDVGYLTGAQTDGVWHITGTVAEEAGAARFTPDAQGRLLVRGLDAGSYTLTEVSTVGGYSLLSKPVTLTITAQPSQVLCCPVCGAAELTATASVDGQTVAMTADGESANAFVPLTVVNYPEEELPGTGDSARLMLYIFGGMMILSAAGITVLLCRKKKTA